MSARFSQTYGDVYTYKFWLVFASDGAIRLTRGTPSLGRDERGMSCKAKLPASLFKTPTLSATIELSDPGPDAFRIDVDAAGDALRQVLGCDIDLQIKGPTE